MMMLLFHYYNFREKPYVPDTAPDCDARQSVSRLSSYHVRAKSNESDAINVSGLYMFDETIIENEDSHVQDRISLGIV